MSDLHSLLEQVPTDENILSTDETTDHENNFEENEFHQQQITTDDQENNFEENELCQQQITTDDQENNFEENELRQRQITTNHSNASYDLLEQDLAYLREAIDEVAALVAKQQQQQEQLLSRAESLRTTTQSRFSNLSSFAQKAIHNRYVSIASGAVLGASIGGPIGLTVGTKIGALVALSGSALGALSMNIMRQRATETDESQNNDTTAYNQAML